MELHWKLTFMNNRRDSLKRNKTWIYYKNKLTYRVLPLPVANYSDKTKPLNDRILKSYTYNICIGIYPSCVFALYSRSSIYVYTLHNFYLI